MSRFSAGFPGLRARRGVGLAGSIGAGVLVLLGSPRATEREEAVRLAGKVARLRVFENDEGRFDRSLLDTGGAALVVSQFTLLADSTSKGTRPTSRGRPARGRGAAVRALLRGAAGAGVPVETGVFGARMEVSLVNDGPVTIVLDVD